MKRKETAFTTTSNILFYAENIEGIRMADRLTGNMGAA